MYNMAGGEVGLAASGVVEAVDELGDETELKLARELEVEEEPVEE